MAPEQWTGAPATDRVDSWALGIVIAQLLTGAHPLGDDTDERRDAARDPARVAAWSTERRDVPGAIAELITRSLEREPTLRPSAAEWARVLDAAILDGRGDAVVEDGPYRGLAAFDEKHARFYFGRELEIDGFLERLRDAPHLPIVGPSGAGKSSFLHAGVIPRLRAREPWTVIAFRPGADPVGALARHVLGRDQRRPASRARPSETQLKAQVQAFRAELLETPTLLAARLATIASVRDGRVLLAVDQLEEAFTQGAGEAERQHFLQMLLAAADDPLDPVRVVVTVRDDFVGKLAGLRSLFVVKQLGVDDVRRTITGPLARYDYQFDDAGDRRRPDRRGRQRRGRQPAAAAVRLPHAVGRPRRRQPPPAARDLPRDGRARRRARPARRPRAHRAVARRAPHGPPAPAAAGRRDDAALGGPRSAGRRRRTRAPTRSSTACCRRACSSSATRATASRRSSRSRTSRWSRPGRSWRAGSTNRARSAACSTSSRTPPGCGSAAASAPRTPGRRRELSTARHRAAQLDLALPARDRAVLRRRRCTGTSATAAPATDPLGIALAIAAIVAVPAFVMIARYLSREQLIQSNIGTVDLAIVPFDWVASAPVPAGLDQVPRSVVVVVRTKRDDIDDHGDQLPEDFVRILPASNVGASRTQRIRAPGGPVFLKIEGRGRPDERCAPSWIRIQSFPGYRTDDIKNIVRLGPDLPGDLRRDRDDRERPVHLRRPRRAEIEVLRPADYTEPEQVIDLPAFAIDRTEVSNAAFAPFGQLGRVTGYLFPVYATYGTDNDHARDADPTYPVSNIDAFEAKAYCEYMGKRLPSDHQWTKAARGGLKIGGKPNPYPRRLYPWGTDENLQCVNQLGDKDGYPWTAPGRRVSVRRQPLRHPEPRRQRPGMDRARRPDRPR